MIIDILIQYSNIIILVQLYYQLKECFSI